jgi:hypothetical protein
MKTDAFQGFSDTSGDEKLASGTGFATVGDQANSE